MVNPSIKYSITRLCYDSCVSCLLSSDLPNDSQQLVQMHLTYLVDLAMGMPTYGRFLSDFFSKKNGNFLLFCLVLDITCQNVLNQVNKPLVGPIILNGHEGEVTAVDWYVFELKSRVDLKYYLSNSAMYLSILNVFIGANLRLGS